MLGIIAEIFVSWLLLWFVEKKHISVLGIRPTGSRMRDLFVGLLLSSLICSLYQLSIVYFAGDRWLINKDFTVQAFLSGSWWTLNSVLFEELIFRGALLYIAIRKTGTDKACILSACCFGVYHWFSYGAFGNTGQMLIIFLMTGVAGLMFAFAFAKTNSLYLPIGLHFGWNLFSIVVFSNGPLGHQLLLRDNENVIGGLLSLITFLFQVFALPALVFWYLKRTKKEYEAKN